MSQKKHELKDLRTTLLARGWALTKASLKAGSLTASQLLHSDSEKKSAVWLNRLEGLVEELGQLKGTAMKVGQTFSMYGENLLPKEVNEQLKKLQQTAPPLSWETMQEVLMRELGEEKLTQLEIDTIPVASASIGQVYRAKIKNGGQALALKVQYPGVDLSVETDLKLLKFILNMTDLVPRGPRFDQIFAEIRDMFHQEVNYERELAFAEEFAEHLKDDPRFRVPKVYREFSTRKVLAYEFLTGVRADHESVRDLSEARRNRLGLNFFSLYLRELLDLRLMQTDPHIGNYLIQIDPTGSDDRLLLLDFGAVREVPSEFLRNYSLLIAGGLRHDAELIERGGRALNLLLPDDSMDLVRDYVQLSLLLIEPFAEGHAYDWGTSDLPKRVAMQVGKVATSYRLRAPPRELVFLDRKLGGVFVFLSILKCKMQARGELQTALDLYFKTNPNS